MAQYNALFINSVLGRNLEAPRLIQFESLTYAMRISIIVSTTGAHKHSRVQAVLSRYYIHAAFVGCSCSFVTYILWTYFWLTFAGPLGN